MTPEELDFLRMVDDAMNEVDDLEVTFHDATRLTSEVYPYSISHEGTSDNPQVI